MVQAATSEDPILQQVAQFINTFLVNGCIMLQDFETDPSRMLGKRNEGIKAIACNVVHWLKIDEDIKNFVRRCGVYAIATKSQHHHQSVPWSRAK